jgi:hypothetical protein
MVSLVRNGEISMRIAIIAACIVFGVGAFAGRMTVNTASATDRSGISPYEMMKSSYGLPVESYTAI